MATKSLNIAVIGDVNCGKSTLLGHIRYQIGEINQQTLSQYRKEAKKIGQQNSIYAWIMDIKKAERQNGYTIDSKPFKIQGLNFHLSFLDTPGHRDYMKNMITSLSQSDVSLLVISAAKGEYESSSERNKELITMAYTLGSKQVVIAVTKMDHQNINWSQRRFQEIEADTQNYLTKIGYQENFISFVAVSGWTGENLTKGSLKQGWQNDLISTLDSLTCPWRHQQRALRIPILRIYKISGVGIIAGGIIESGVLKVNDTVSFAPSKIANIKVKSIQQFETKQTQATAGNMIGFSLQNVGNKDIKVGDVCGLASKDPPKQSVSFTAFIVILSHPGIIVKGYTPIMYIHTSQFAVRFQDLLQKIERKTGEIIEDKPRSLKAGDAAMVKFTPLKPVSVERFRDYPKLGRFVCRDIKQVVCVGIIHDVEKIDHLQEKLRGMGSR